MRAHNCPRVPTRHLLPNQPFRPRRQALVRPAGLRMSQPAPAEGASTPAPAAGALQVAIRRIDEGFAAKGPFLNLAVHFVFVGAVVHHFHAKATQLTERLRTQKARGEAIRGSLERPGEIGKYFEMEERLEEMSSNLAERGEALAAARASLEEAKKSEDRTVRGKAKAMVIRTIRKDLTDREELLRVEAQFTKDQLEELRAEVLREEGNLAGGEKALRMAQRQLMEAKIAPKTAEERQTINRKTRIQNLKGSGQAVPPEDALWLLQVEETAWEGRVREAEVALQSARSAFTEEPQSEPSAWKISFDAYEAAVKRLDTINNRRSLCKKLRETSDEKLLALHLTAPKGQPSIEAELERAEADLRRAEKNGEDRTDDILEWIGAKTLALKGEAEQIDLEVERLPKEIQGVAKAHDITLKFFGQIADLFYEVVGSEPLPADQIATKVAPVLQHIERGLMAKQEISIADQEAVSFDPALIKHWPGIKASPAIVPMARNLVIFEVIFRTILLHHRKDLGNHNPIGMPKVMKEVRGRSLEPLTKALSETFTTGAMDNPAARKEVNAKIDVTLSADLERALAAKIDDGELERALLEENKSKGSYALQGEALRKWVQAELPGRRSAKLNHMKEIELGRLQRAEFDRRLREQLGRRQSEALSTLFQRGIDQVSQFVDWFSDPQFSLVMKLLIRLRLTVHQLPRGENEKRPQLERLERQATEAILAFLGMEKAKEEMMRIVGQVAGAFKKIVPST